jgi:hypothetical protein
MSARQISAEVSEKLPFLLASILEETVSMLSEIIETPYQARERGSIVVKVLC